MPDVFTKEKRSWVMSRIKGKDTEAEKNVEIWLKSNKIKFEKQFNIPGKPDFVITKRNIALFVDGDFWHGYNYESRREKLNGYWRNKIENNMKRDKIVNKKLRLLGWKVVRIWEHVINSDNRNFEFRMKKLL